jgi:hypothetical protein
MGAIVVIGMMLFGIDNAEFIETSNAQQEAGYEWSYVGKQEPSGTPALVAEGGNGEKFILFRLEK